MTTLVFDTLAEEQILADRRAKGLDRYDEVWDGVYVMSPLPEWDHQEVVVDLTACLRAALRRQGLGRAVAGCNVSDRATNWTQNYRCPDVVVYLNDTSAKFHGTHWEGGPDFAIEIVSENDHTWEKLAFYAQVKTRELLIVNRNPWKLTLLSLAGDRMAEVGGATVSGSEELRSTVIPFCFRLVNRPYGLAIEIKNLADGQISYAPEEGPPPESLAVDFRKWLPYLQFRPSPQPSPRSTEERE